MDKKIINAAIKQSGHYADIINGILYVSKSFQTNANYYGTTEYHKMNEILTVYPDMKVELYAATRNCCVLRLNRLTSSVMMVSPSLAISRSIWSCFFVLASPCSYSKMTSSAPAALSSFICLLMSCLLSFVEHRAYPYIIVFPPAVKERVKCLIYSFAAPKVLILRRFRLTRQL